MKRIKKRPKTDIKYLKAKRVIPKDTYYCYNAGEWLEDGYGYYVTVCPFYKRIPESTLVAKCNLVEGEVWDMCKICGINE